MVQDVAKSFCLHNCSSNKEKKLKVQVQHDLMFITGEFQMMQSFLNVANAERAKNEVVRTWVRQIRDLAFDVEDCIEFVVHLDNKSDWTWLWRVLPACMGPPRPLDLAVNDIKQLRARVEDVSQRNTRYSLIGDSGESSVHVSPAELQPATPRAEAAFRILSEVWEEAGKWRGMGDLQELITGEGSGLQVISLWGICSSTGVDLGLTSVIQKAYYNSEILQKFRTRAWVKLTHPFNRNEFVESLLTQIHASPHQHQHQAAAVADLKGHVLMKAELMRQLHQQRYLVVLEGLSATVEWDVIKMYLPESNKGSRIIVTTKQLGVAILCTGEPYQISELGKFSDGQSLCALLNKGGGEGDMLQVCSLPPSRRRGWYDEYKPIGDHAGEAYRRLKKLSQESWPTVISVWGIAGVGKSTLVKHVYCDQMDYHRPAVGHVAFSWVDVPHPFNLTDFAWQLLLDFHSHDLEAKEIAALGMMQDQDPIQECHKFMREKKCLVVIDGLRSTDDWNLIKAAFLSKPIKGCIVVITNEESVAKCCADEEKKVVNLKGLQPSISLCLFKKIYCGHSENLPYLGFDSETDLPFHFKKLAELVSAKCGGFPTVITAICQHINKADDLAHACLFEDLSDDFFGILEKDPKFRCLRGLFSWMRSYFDACPDSLKPCIFYLSVFAIDKKIRRGRLLRRWIAEGYSRDTARGDTADEEGRKFFSQLVKLSIIQHRYKTPSKFEVNSFFHGYIMSRPMEDNLVFELDGHCSPSSRRVGQHLTIRSSWHRDETVFKNMDLSRLRSLTVSGKWELFLISSSNMRLLRVLDLEDTQDLKDDDLDKIDKLPPRLKFLSLRGCTEISRLPSSLSDLRQLQTLDVRYTKISALTPAIKKLYKLQYIHAGTMMVPPEAPPEVASESEAPSEVPPEVSSEVPLEVPSELPPEVSPEAPPEVLPDEEEEVSSAAITRPWRSRLSRMMKKKKVQKSRAPNVGVNVAAAGIGNLTDLRTLGIVDVSGKGGKDVLQEIGKLTQLRKLGVSGINRENWEYLWSAISNHGHLESLSMYLDDDDDKAGDGVSGISIDIDQLPQTLKSLKVYGGDVRVNPAWIEKIFKRLRGLKKVDVDITISTDEDMKKLVEIAKHSPRRLSIKKIQGGELCFADPRPATPARFAGRGEYIWLKNLKIDCTSGSKLKVTFGFHWVILYVDVLKIHCPSESSTLQIVGLRYLFGLKEVWVTGFCSNDLEQDLRNQCESHPTGSPVLRIARQPSS